VEITIESLACFQTKHTCGSRIDVYLIQLSHVRSKSEQMIFFRFSDKPGQAVTKWAKIESEGICESKLASD
jgi:hypothetical protein